MKNLYTYIIFLIPLLSFSKETNTFTSSVENKDSAAIDSTSVYLLSLPYKHQNDIYQDVYIENTTSKIIQVTINCIDITNPGDSVQVYILKNKIVKKIKNKTLYSSIQLSKDDKKLTFNPVYYKILSRGNSLPTGDYLVKLKLVIEERVVEQDYTYHIDSMLVPGSSISRTIDNIYSESSNKSFLGITYGRRKTSDNRFQTFGIIRQTSTKVDKALKKRGFDVNYRYLNNKRYADVFCEDKYVGYYEVDLNMPLSKKIDARKETIKNPLSDVDNSLNQNKPILSQIKELKGEKNEKEVKGQLNITGNVSTGQEEYSQSDNNYYEVAGQIEAPIMNIPVTISGYYTSQDKGRTIKSSYIRFHYDSDESKNELLNLISGYNKKYRETVSKGDALNGIYSKYIENLQSEKGRLLNDMQAETGIPDIEKYKIDTSGLFDRVVRKIEKKAIDTLNIKHADSSKLAQDKEAAKNRYKKIVEDIRKVQKLEDNVKHYKALLEKYSENRYIDSALVFDKVKDIEGANTDNLSYKQLSKSAASLLPPGENKKAITGITSFDLGIFSKNISAYTLNGQNIKGADVGYDLGLFEVGITCGNVDYVSRDGVLDRYVGYSGRASFKPGKQQKVSLVYFGYAPGKRMLNQDTFFKDVDVYMPTFREPINILSIIHSGVVADNVNVESEVATSYRAYREFENSDVGKLSEKMAYRIGATWAIPYTSIDVKAGYEHIGEKFENNTLPLNLSGTDKYNASVKNDFLKGFLTVGVEYNYLLQRNFVSRSANSKWGFEVKTNSKRYPSASISYKPFSTFRSFSDTFNIPQRPILGEVWLGKLSYQWKNQIHVFRITAIYNKNTAIADTVASNSNVSQLNLIYNRGKLFFMSNAGQTQVGGSNLSAIHNKTTFFAIAVGYTLNDQWNVSAGQDIAFIRTGLSRYAANIGAAHQLRKVPLVVRGNFRYNQYRTSEIMPWRSIYSGMLDVTWQFKCKLKEKV